MSEASIQRVVIYSHDTFGLGHLTRSRRIARVVVEALPHAHVLIVSGSPVAHKADYPPRVDYLKLPSVVKLGADRYGARELGISGKEIRNLRRSLILTAVRGYRPDLFMVDNVPLGMKKELRPTLEFLRKRCPDTRIHLNLRDILDSPERLLRSWRKLRIAEVIAESYDEIDIFGDRDVFDAVAAYELPADRTRYLGYLAPVLDPDAGPSPAAVVPRGRRRILVTIGGGGDGERLLETIAEIAGRDGLDSTDEFEIVTGPLMQHDVRRALLARLEAAPSTTVSEYQGDLPRRMAAADLVISMGGYNTLCEVMAVARRSLVVPREHPRREQLLRAERLAGRGVVRVLRFSALDAGSLRSAIDAALAEPAWIPQASLPCLTGADNLARRLQQLDGISLAPTGATSAAVTGGLAPLSRHGTVKRRRETRRPNKLGGFLLLLVLAPWLLVSGSAGAFELKPQAVEARVEFGHDDNILHSSDEEVRAFETGSPDAYFVVDSLDDEFVELEAQGEWLLGRPWNSKTDLGLGFRRRQYATETIKNENAYVFALSTRPASDTRVKFEVLRVPWMYGRHRTDKTALPGEPRFRPEVQNRWYAETEVSQRLGDRWRIGAVVVGLWQRYDDPFRERDRDRLRTRAESRWQASRRTVARLELGYERCWSRNQTDLPKDLSHRQWEVRPRVTISDLWADLGVDLDLRLRYREYLTDNPENENHYQREDILGSFGAALWRPLGPRWTASVAYEHYWRNAELDSGADIDFDEEGSSRRSLITGGLTWSWEPD